MKASTNHFCHRQEHAANFQLGVDLPLDASHRAHQLRHVLRRQIVHLDGDQHIVGRGQGVDDQHTQRGAAIQQNIVICTGIEKALVVTPAPYYRVSNW